MSNRIGLGEAYNRSQMMNITSRPSSIMENNRDGERKTAEYSILECERNALKLENTKLRSQLDEVRSALKQLSSESCHEKFDERRINLIKFQTIQLERQIAVLTEALGSRQESLYEVENVMVWLGNKLRSLTTTNSKSPVVLETGVVKQMIENIESSRIKLFKSLENSTKEATGKDLLLLNPFLGGKFKKDKNVSLLDICLQRMDYINLQHVSLLESKLSTLYKDLIHLDVALNTGSIQGISANKAERRRLDTIILKTSINVKDAADDLLSLSLLCPSAPWKELKKPICQQVPIEKVKAALPPLPKSKQEEVTHLIEACIKTCNHRQLLVQKKNESLKTELSFHRAVYDLQMQYTQDLIDAVRTGYREFETSFQTGICHSIKNLLIAYSKLKKSASEEALKEFLIFIKENENQLASFVDMLSTQDINHEDKGETLLSKFGENFIDSINSLVYQCQEKRDKSMNENKVVQEQQSQLDEELRRLIEELEAKYNKQWTLQSTVRERQNIEGKSEQSLESYNWSSEKQNHSASAFHYNYNSNDKTNPERAKSIPSLDSNSMQDLSALVNKESHQLYNSSLNKIPVDNMPKQKTSDKTQINTFSRESLKNDNSNTVPHRRKEAMTTKPCVPLVAKRSLKLQRPRSLPSIDSNKKDKSFDVNI